MRFSTVVMHVKVRQRFFFSLKTAIVKLAECMSTLTVYIRRASFVEVVWKLIFNQDVPVFFTLPSVPLALEPSRRRRAQESTVRLSLLS
jgi:hypothetical protein